MSARLAFLHTNFVLVDPIRSLSRELLRDTPTFHVVDESLLSDILAAGGLTNGVIRRIARLAISAEEAGAATVVLTCSSASPSVGIVRSMLKVPLLAIDEAMAEEAVARAVRIGVLATVRTTIQPTRDLVEAKARTAHRRVEVLAEVCAEAFEALMRGERGEHDRLVTARCRALAQKVELILFAQGSMAPLAEQLRAEIPILTSLELGVRRAGEVFCRETARA
jgi:Asp/Glu/hydantoin racemase